MAEITKLKKQNKSLTQQKKLAWGKYYGELNETMESNKTVVQLFKNLNEINMEIPTHLKNEISEMMEKLKMTYECPICLTAIEKEDLKITNCGHKYCKGCFDKLLETTNKCAICKKVLVWKK